MHQSTSADLSTWLFLGTLSLVTIGVLAFYGWAISGYRPPKPMAGLQEPGRFESARASADEVDLGHDWYSSNDRGAKWHLYFYPSRCELTGLRVGALPQPSALVVAGRGRGSAMRDTAHNHPPYAGMRVLAGVDTVPRHGHLEHLRALPDGLDRLLEELGAEPLG